MSLVKNRMSIGNLACVLLLIAIVCVQLFAPFYTYHNNYSYKDKETKKTVKVKEVSTISYGTAVWFPKRDDVKSLETHFKSNDMFGKVNKYGEPYGRTEIGAILRFNLDEMAYPHLYTVVLAGFSLVFFLMKRNGFVPSALALAAGVITTKAFLTNRVLTIGLNYPSRVVGNMNVCTINVVLGITLICVALFSLFGGFILNPLAKKMEAKKAAKQAAQQVAEQVTEG